MRLNQINKKKEKRWLKLDKFKNNPSSNFVLHLCFILFIVFNRYIGCYSRHFHTSIIKSVLLNAPMNHHLAVMPWARVLHYDFSNWNFFTQSKNFTTFSCRLSFSFFNNDHLLYCTCRCWRKRSKFIILILLHSNCNGRSVKVKQFVLQQNKL